MSAGERVTVVEVGPRDGLQNEAAIVPAVDKVRFVDALAETGLPVVEVTSFVSPEAVPQLVELAETLQCAVVDRKQRMNFPTRHPLEQSGSRAAIAQADLIVGMEVMDFSGVRSQKAGAASGPGP